MQLLDTTQIPSFSPLSHSPKGKNYLLVIAGLTNTHTHTPSQSLINYDQFHCIQISNRYTTKKPKEKKEKEKKMLPTKIKSPTKHAK